MTEDERKTLAVILRARRTELGLSARELARRAGVDSGTVVLLEQSKITHPRVETVRALSEAMSLPLAAVFTATNWLPEGALPGLRPYMRAKYGPLSDEDLARVEQFVARLSGHRPGPRPGEDE